MEQENLKKEIHIPYSVNLESWDKILQSIKNTGLSCSVENEDYKNGFFFIGKIEKIKNKKFFIRNFVPKGLIDTDATEITYKSISIVKFDNDYTNIMSKYATTEM